MPVIPWRLIALVFVAALLLAGGAEARRKLTAEQATLKFLREFAKEYKNVLRPLWTGTDYCSWSGVSCAANGEVSVDLSGRGLVGKMPEVDDDEGRLSLVVSIDLSNNPGIRDDFESDWKHLANLRVMNLSYTSLRGDIPNDWRRMSSLEEVYVHHTAACKSLPEWRGMANLRVVDLSFNNFQGSLRQEWSQLPALQSVNLAGNAFCGCVPQSWNGNAVLTNAAAGLAASDASTCHANRCTRAKTCPYEPNSVTTAAPGSTAVPTSKRPATTTAPSTPAHEKEMTRLFLSRIAASFPSQLSGWTGTDYCSWSGVSCAANGEVSVDLSGRGLVGKMPEVDDDEGRLSLVVSIDLSNNPGIRDDFESDWKHLANLRVMNLSYTSLRGDIPNDWRRMSSLEEVYVHHTAACKSLPEWRGMANLRVVDLSFNNFQGSLRQEWSQLPALQSVNLAGNAFCGCVPQSWNGNAVLTNAAAGLAASDASTCHANRCTRAKTCPYEPNSVTTAAPGSTAVPTSKRPATTTAPSTPAHEKEMTRLFLSRIAASFPSQLSGWTGTDYCSWSGVSCAANGEVSVDLSGRGLSGHLSTLRGVDGPAVRVVSLDLSSNMGIGGSFVDNWASLSRLRSLDMSKTSVHGFIPSAWNGMSSLETINLSETQACGGLPNWGKSMVSLRMVNLSHTKMRGVLASSWASLPALESADLSGNAFCGCVPAAWRKNAVLEAAAAGANSGLTATKCAKKNRCSLMSYICW